MRQEIDRQAFAKAVLSHKERLWSYALHLTRHHAEAEDLLQLTYLRAFENWSQLRDLKRTCSWLVRMMHSAFVDRYRRAQRAPMVSWEGIDGGEQLLPPVLDPSEQTETRDVLIKAIETLTPTPRTGAHAA